MADLLLGNCKGYARFVVARMDESEITRRLYKSGLDVGSVRG